MSMRHFVDVTDLENFRRLQDLLEQSSQIKAALKCGVKSEAWAPYRHLLDGQVIASIFYEPSTRTRISFESAAIQMGAHVVGTENAGQFSSAIKGESLSDSIKVISEYAHCIVLRHPTNGAAAEAKTVSGVPVINAGDGTGEHPSQALLDFFTIWENFGHSRDLTLTVVGDLANGRTVRSLLKLFGFMRSTELGLVAKVQCVSPPNLRLTRDMLELLNEFDITVKTAEALSPDVLATSDVVYLTRTQLERGSVMKDLAPFTMHEELVKHLPDNSIVIHPLPRNSELPPSIDAYPQARYFKQAANGLYVRMALLKTILT